MLKLLNSLLNPSQSKVLHLLFLGNHKVSFPDTLEVSFIFNPSTRTKLRENIGFVKTLMNSLMLLRQDLLENLKVLARFLVQILDHFLVELFLYTLGFYLCPVLVAWMKGRKLFIELIRLRLGEQESRGWSSLGCNAVLAFQTVSIIVFVLHL